MHEIMRGEYFFVSTCSLVVGVCIGAGNTRPQNFVGGIPLCRGKHLSVVFQISMQEEGCRDTSALTYGALSAILEKAGR